MVHYGIVGGIGQRCQASEQVIHVPGPLGYFFRVERKSILTSY